MTLYTVVVYQAMKTKFIKVIKEMQLSSCISNFKAVNSIKQSTKPGRII